MDLIYTVVLPLAAVVVFALLGMMRGARREAYVSGSIVLAALLITQWAVIWGEDLTDYITGLRAGDAAFYVSLALMTLIVLVIGYGLGSSVVRGAPTGTSRTLGLTLGILNGAAFAGYILREAFISLDNRSGSSPIYTNPVSYWLVFWAGWYPVALAVIGAVVALVRAFAGEDEVAVAPAATTTATTPSLAEPSVAPAAYAGYAASTAGNPPPPSAPTAAYVPPPAPLIAASTTSPVVDLPDEDYRTTAPDLAATRAVSTMAASENTALPSESAAAPMTTIPTGDAKYHTPPFGMPAVSGEGAPEAGAAPAAATVASSGATVSDTKGTGSEAAAAGSKCRTCGSKLEPGQMFCTECGTKVEG
jgi:hypothetical protein